MGKVLLKTQIKRESGKLYYCATSDDGFITVCETLNTHGKKLKKLKEMKESKK